MPSAFREIFSIFDSSVQSRCHFCTNLSHLTLFHFGVIAFRIQVFQEDQSWSDWLLWTVHAAFYQFWADGSAGYLLIPEGNELNVFLSAALGFLGNQSSRLPASLWLWSLNNILRCYSNTSCMLTALHFIKVSSVSLDNTPCCPMKIYINKTFTKMWGAFSLSWDTVTTLSLILLPW